MNMPPRTAIADFLKEGLGLVAEPASLGQIGLDLCHNVIIHYSMIAPAPAAKKGNPVINRKRKR
jgi:hypothetical protein